MTPTWILGLHLLSFHSSEGLNTVTPGIYARHESGATVGLLRNSHSRTSVYAAWTLETEDKHWALTAGVITGYSKARALPMFAPSYKFDAGVRLSIIPNPWGAKVLHVGYERAF